MWHQIAAWVGSIIITVPIVWKFAVKYSPKVKKVLKISDEALDVVNKILEACEDKNISKAEVETILKEYNELQEALK